MVKIIGLLFCLTMLVACGDEPLNSPYPGINSIDKVLFTSFSEQPKTLDPAKSYSSNEYTFLHQIYEPPLTYHYLKRPYQLQPQVLTKMPEISFKVKNKKSYSVYNLELKKGILYQPHPAFAKKKSSQYKYYPINESFLENNDINKLSDFKELDTRELVADDFIYQIKRLADPFNSSPIASLMAEHIVGFKDFTNHITKLRKDNKIIDLRKYNIAGVKKIDRYHYQITINNRYPQFKYWLAMPFFAPVPWEAIQFYSQKGMSDRNISLSWYPIGTGAFMLVENNPNRRMLMKKNPNYHPSYFPSGGSIEDKKLGYLKYAGKRLPMYDSILFSLEKETIPRWNKFLQGYYDFSGVASDSFDQAISVTKTGKPILTKAMKKKGITLQSSVEPSVFYMGFNMLDDVVGGYSKKSQNLRQAISIAINYEEYISIFLNGRGAVSQGPIPPGISGYQTGIKGMNKYVYQWVKSGIERKNISKAKVLLAKAGYPNGRSIQSGKTLILNYDVPGGAGAEEKSYFAWLRKQFNKLGISLNIRATQYNRFQQKMRTGKAQIFSWGWNADYPDPENFLFLFLTNNGKVKFHGENAANYSNKKFDKLFDKMKLLGNGEERNNIINEMVHILQKDSPWIWGFNPKQFSLKQTWLNKTKASPIGAGSLRYLNIDTLDRQQKQMRWNFPILWPLGLIFMLVLVIILPLVLAYYKRVHKARQKIYY